jgi:hypothetical protein
MNPASELAGVWESDNERTVWELRRTLGPRHEKTLDFQSHRFRLIMHYTPDLVIYYYQDIICAARYRAIAEDECSVMVEVEPSQLNAQKLFHIHFLGPSTYWVTVHLDWGLIYREFFRRLPDHLTDSELRTYALRELPDHPVGHE